MPIIPDVIADPRSLPAPGPESGGAAAALAAAAALWTARAGTRQALAAAPAPAAFPDPQVFAEELEAWREGVRAAAEEALEGRPPARDAWRAWFEEEAARLAGDLAEAGRRVAAQRAGAALRQELDAVTQLALDPVRPGDAAAASRDARAALEQAAALGLLEPAEVEAAARGLAARVQAGLAAGQADQDPAGLLSALGAGDFPALDKGERERLAGRARLRLALAQARAGQDAARAAADQKRRPLDRGRFLLRRAEAALRAALAGEGDPAAAQDAAGELAALPGFAIPARELARSLEFLPGALDLLGRTAFQPPAARFAALEQAGDRGAGKIPARSWPGPLRAACREVLEEQAQALAADPAGYVRPEAERRLRAAGLDPQAEPEALLLAVLDLEAGCGVARPGVLSLAEAAALRQAWLARDAAGRVEFLAGLAPFAGFRRRVAAEVLGPRGPVLQLAAESPALCPAEKTAVLAAACAPDPSRTIGGAMGQPGDGADSGSGRLAQTFAPAPGHPALEALAASEPLAAASLAELADRLAAASGDPEDAARLLAALAPAALRLWGQAPALALGDGHAGAYRQDEAPPGPPAGDGNSAPARPREDGEDALQDAAGQESSAWAETVSRPAPRPF